MNFHTRQGDQRGRRPRLTPADVDWIAAHRRPFNDFSVGSLVPVVFEAYARVLHPAWGPSDGKDPTVRWDTVAVWSGRTIRALAQWESLSRPVAMPAAVAPFVTVPYGDSLPPDGLAALCDVLAAHTRTPDDCFIGVWDGYGWPVEAWAGPDRLDLENHSYLVRRGPLALAYDVDPSSLSGQRLEDGPNLLWPADRAWFVASDTDLDSTYLGGTAALIESLLAHPSLEAWPIAATDRITSDSDHVNER